MEEAKEEKQHESDDSLELIRVRVIQGRNLPSTDVNGSTDPYVVVHIGARKPMRTPAIKRDKNPVWNTDLEVLERGLRASVDSIRFELFDKDTFTRDDLVGSAEIDIKRCWDNVTPAMWISLKNKKGKPIKGQVQVQLQCMRKGEPKTMRDFTHVLAVTIQKGVELHDMDWIGRADPFVEFSLGAQSFRTKEVQNSTNPEWNETAYLFVDSQKESDYQMKFTVVDVDVLQDEDIGTAYLPAKSLFDAGTFEGTISLRQHKINKDAELSSSQDMSDALADCGQLQIQAKLIEKATVEKEFFEFLVAEFDDNHDHSLQKDEVATMFAVLHIAADVDEFFKKYDKNLDDELDRNEILRMLESSEFQDSPVAPQMLQAYLQQQGHGVINSHLMMGVTHHFKTTGRRTIIVKDRRSGLLVQENIPDYIALSLRLMYNSRTGRALAHTTRGVMTNMSKKQGRKYDKAKSVEDIPDFIKLHNLDVTIVDKPVEEFRTFNDFFARGLKPDARPLASDDPNVVLSPADCRMMAWPNFFDSSDFWVKGSKWTVENLLGPRKAVASTYSGGGFVIARLAPQDYHRWHWPVSGRVEKITPIDGALYTVNPIAINQPINVYTENKRCLIELITPNFGHVLMVAVGATMVGSYNLFKSNGVPLSEGDEICRGDVSGEFRFGGSTVLILFQANAVQFDEDLVTSSIDKLETLMQVNMSIGTKA